MGLPVTRPGHIDVVYDTVGKPTTFEVAVRVLAERGTLVYTGVSTPDRWEWSPVYFKELVVTGSNAFGVEEFEGVRKHAIPLYLDLVADGRVDIAPMLTHRFALEDWRGALRSLALPADSGALKVAFEPNRA
jgi:threonine dehydrogenase-like Zn-dependent dehydrogenase